jgi:hypothetical protein
MQILATTLNKDSVSIKSDEYGMRAYINSTRGRAQLESECPAEIVQQVYAVWGDKPTVTEPTYSESPTNPQPSSQDRVNAEIMVQIAQLKAANEK